METIISNFHFHPKKTASAIECYNCESTYEEGCGFVFDSEEYFKVNCENKAPPRFIEQSVENANATACMKRIYVGK